jgi:hypothetical protein
MRCNDDPEFLRQLERVIEFRVVDAEGALVSEEDLERGHPVTDDFPELLLGPGVEARHPHVKAIIAGRLAFTLRPPRFVSCQRLIRPRRAAHIEDRGRAANQGRLATSLIGILRKRCP